MIVFKYDNIMEPESAHLHLGSMDIPGEACNEDMRDDMKCVWRGDKFLALYYPSENTLELYGTKNTNSINFYIMKYPSLDWDSWHKVQTKRW